MAKYARTLVIVYDRLIVERIKMNATTALDILDSLLESAEVRKNIEAEAQRKADIETKIARAMDRVSREWR